MIFTCIVGTSFTCIVGTSFTMLRLFSHKVSSNINPLFTHLCEALWANSVKFFAEASELFMHVVFHLVVVLESTSSEYIRQEAQNMEIGGC